MTVDSRPDRQERRIRPSTIVGGAAVLALASLAIVSAHNGFSDFGTVFGNMSHGHNIFSSFGNYSTITHPAHIETIQASLNIHGVSVPGAKEISDKIVPNPNGSGFSDVSNWLVPGTTKTTFAPFNFQDYAAMIGDISVAALVPAYGIAKGRVLLRRSA